MTVDRTAPPPIISSATADDINFTPVATGSKLGLPLDIQFTSNPCVDEEMNNESLLMGTTPPPSLPTSSTSTSSFLSVESLTTPKYVTLTGQKSVIINPGAYACELSHPSTKQYFFRFFLDFPNVVTRNDAIIPAERIYFMSSCWKSEDNMINKARHWKEIILNSLSKLNNEIETMENNEHTMVGLVARTTSFPKYIELLKQRKSMIQQLEMLEDGFPLDRPLINGPNDTVFLKEGVVAVKRVYGGGGGKIQTRYHWIGTFAFKDFVYNAEEEKSEKEEENK